MKKVLYVEDESDIREIVRDELKSCFDICCVEGVEQAKGLLENQNFDFIIVDLHLGNDTYGTDVFTFLEEAKIKFSTELFILSGYVDLVDFTNEEFGYLLNPKNIYLKPEGTFKLFDDLRNR